MEMASPSADSDSKKIGASPVTNGKREANELASSRVKAARQSPPEPCEATSPVPGVAPCSTHSAGNGSTNSSSGERNGVSQTPQSAPTAAPPSCAAAALDAQSSPAEADVTADIHQRREDLLRTFCSHLGSQSIGGANGGAPLSVSPPPTYGKGTAAEAAAKRLSAAGMASPGGIGVFGGGRMDNTRTASSIIRCLHRDDSDSTGGAFCSLPGLDLHSEGDPTTADPLPGVGKSFAPLPDQNGDSKMSSVSSSSADSSVSSGNNMPPPAPKEGGGGRGGKEDMKIPAMAASVISSDRNNGSAPSNSTGGATAEDKNAAVSASSERAASANENAIKLEQAAARNLGLRTVWTRSSASQAPPAMLRSFSDSFSSLVDSRVRAWTLLLLRHSLSNGDEQSRSRLLGLLATSSSILLTAVVTTFQPLNLPPEVKAKVEAEKKEGKSENDVVLPIIFEALTDVTIQGQPFTVPLRAPGTISAKFSRSSELITYVEVKLDTNALVSSMVEQARLVVFKAVAKATALPNSSLGLGSQFESSSMLSSTQMAANRSRASIATLAQFNSTLSLSNSDSNKQRLDKASQPNQQKSPPVIRSSSYLANHSSTLLSRTRKNRSVTWKSAHEEPRVDSANYPTAKRRRLEVPVPTLKTTRSFGKPDAGLFESQKNATFAEFGRSHQHSQVPAFVNGKLQVPNGFQQDSAGGGLSGRSMGNLSANRNATFAGLSMTPRNGLVPNMGGASLGRGSLGAANASFNFSSNCASRTLSQSVAALTRNPSDPFSLIRRSNSGMVRGGIGGNSHSAMPRTATALESLLLSAAKGNRGGLSKR
mmetsp:Transcript_25564/g.38023  ORF Transcript_25564/g.38023 Transcript_25564/m.38023 type:complete len:821 (-) Transcript_25564:618-3080(-)